MSKHEDAWDKLDTEFDHYLVDMKPYVLKLPHKSGKPTSSWLKEQKTHTVGFLYETVTSSV